MAQLKICSTNGMRGERGEWGARGRECRLVEFCGRRAVAVTKGAAHTICASMQNLWQRIYCQATRKNVNGAAALQMKAWHDTSRGKARRCYATNVEMSRRADPREIQNLVSNAKPPKKALGEVQVFSVLPLWATYVRG